MDTINPADKIDASSIDVLQEWANQWMSKNYPPLTPPLNLGTSAEATMERFKDHFTSRPDPVHIMISDAPTWGEFAAVLRVLAAHMDRTMRLHAFSGEVPYEIVSTQIVIRRLIDNATNSFLDGFQVAAQLVVKAQLT